MSIGGIETYLSIKAGYTKDSSSPGPSQYSEERNGRPYPVRLDERP